MSGSHVTNQEPLIPKTEVDAIGKKMMQTQETLRIREKQYKRAGRALSALRLLVQAGNFFLICFLVAGFFISHPLIDGPNKVLAIWTLVAFAVVYSIALHFSKGDAAVVLFLAVSGTAVFSFSLGLGVCEFRKYLTIKIG